MRTAHLTFDQLFALAVAAVLVLGLVAFALRLLAGEPFSARGTMHTFGAVRRFVCCLLMSVALPLPAWAAQATEVRREQGPSGPAALDEPRSVYDLSPGADVSLIALGTGLVALDYALSSRLIVETCPCDASTINPLDRTVVGNHSLFADRASDLGVGLLILGLPVADLFDVGLSDVFVEDAVVYAEALALNGAAVAIVKYWVQRPLPRTYAGDQALIDSPGGYRSFYSGHTSLTAAALSSAAMTWTLRHGLSPWPWLAAGVLTVAIGGARVAAGRHFYSDVAVGAVAGTVVGLAVTYAHRRPEEGQLAIAPSRGGVAAVWTRAF